MLAPSCNGHCQPRTHAASNFAVRFAGACQVEADHLNMLVGSGHMPAVTNPLIVTILTVQTEDRRRVHGARM